MRSFIGIECRLLSSDTDIKVHVINKLWEMGLVFFVSKLIARQTETVEFNIIAGYLVINLHLRSNFVWSW